MRPIELTIQGLHSFREKQVVDFAALCEGGVFGIFGPTGSGKSSILDAMTLSLYGKVERAPSNTQGILNHAEDQLGVSFTFSLGRGERENRYKVERTFKRVKEDGLRQATARFIDLTGDASVVADKAGDVTREVESLLGLSIDDFTRAVVLPQGKFSEFLSLKGTERRQMLQRLFHLEKYGDELNYKLRRRLTAANHQKELIEKEQAGLGEASNEAVESAKLKVSHLRDSITKQESTVEYEQEQYDQAKQWREWSLQLQSVMKEQNELKKMKEEIENRKSDIRKASEANVLYPYVQEVTESKQQINIWKVKESQSKELVSKIEKDLISSKSEYERAVKEQQSLQLPLEMKVEKLNQMKAKTEELTKRKSDASRINERLQSLSKQIEKLKIEQDEAKRKRSKYEEGQNHLKRQLSSVNPNSEEKKQMQKATDHKHKVRSLEDNIAELSRQEESLKKEKQTLTSQWKTVQAELERKQQHLNNRFIQVNRWYNLIMEKKNMLHKVVKGVERIKAEQDTLRLERAAHDLRKTLKDGQPCPVCGTSHQEHSGVQVGALEKDLSDHFRKEETLKEQEQQAQKLEKSMDEVVWKLNQTARHSPVKPELTSEEDNMIDDQLELPPISDESFSHQWENWSEQWNKEHEAIEKLLNHWENEVNEWSTSKEELNKLDLVIKQLDNRLNELLEDKKDKSQLLEKELTLWQEQFPNIPYNQVDQLAEEIRSREEQSDELRQRIEKSIPIIEGISLKRDELNDELQQALVDRSKYESEHNERMNTIKDMEKEIHEITEGKDLDQLVESYKTKLTAINKDVTESNKRLEETEKRMKLAEIESAESTHSFQEALNRFERSVSRWDEQIKDSFFNEITEVESWKTDLSLIDEWEEEVSLFENKQRDVSIKQKQLQQQLKRGDLSENAFSEIEKSYRLAKKELEQLRTDLGAAKHHLDEILKRAARYEELEKERLEFETLHGKLNKLDKVFRGKEFVEFIAEEQLIQVSRLASERLRVLTRGRYAIEVDSNGGFIMRDDANGGIKRPVTTLSGGETFLTSLALALSLSASIQLRGEHALEFFFLDEGFGTLDPELLETVVTALEHLHTDQLSVGVISHVPELKERLPRKLMVTQAESGGRGSRISLEEL
ncbi:hypothetical protein CR194_06180 [Salipaludibacillus keqinensis]|uniref:Nuclease SbcCD subunit C n=1 Tax=Salipaludibacillus keqinensis TaxID=2045207 RepID=A0A323TJY8_9BACI|nr:SbcC/MukB-like Walker B domain-containing protein [Salipaludibacillus keqinensis]PYZ95099.1 hypothetical protein CR194_06180 [Salipaludibacillus keqinensis]